MLHYTIKKLEKTHKKFLNTNPLLIIIIGKTYFPSGSNEYKKFEQNNRNIALNILPVPPNKEGINIICKSQYNRNREKQVVLLMITNNSQENTPDKWHYLAVKTYLDYSEV